MAQPDATDTLWRNAQALVKSNKNDFVNAEASARWLRARPCALSRRSVRAYMQRLEHQSGRLACWVRTMLTRRYSNVGAGSLHQIMSQARPSLSTHTNLWQIRRC
uniref:Uncharacterized protein n=1 Tax=Mycetohabitans sp. TaxID=2571162 RepID=A0A6B9HCX1_9BURK|nr:hypothetical protein [Mycetohabitans sp.]